MWDRYEPLTVHDSSLSFGIHALLAFRLGLSQEGWRYFERSLCFDLNDELGNTGREGIHMAALGASWQALVYGALGLWSDGGELRLTARDGVSLVWSAMVGSSQLASRRSCTMSGLSLIHI